MRFLRIAALLVVWFLANACEDSWHGDGVCDRTCMTPGNAFDSSSNSNSDCAGMCESHCQSANLGNSQCDQDCNSWDCGWDLGDCGDCRIGCSGGLVGDGNCDDSCDFEECSFDGGDCDSELQPRMWFVTAIGTAIGDGSFDFPFRSFSRAVESLWLPHNAIFLLSGDHALSPTTSPTLLSYKGLVTTQISTLFCESSPRDHLECASTRASLHVTPQFLSFTVAHSVVFESISFRGDFSLKLGCLLPTCFYCPYLIFDTGVGAYTNDRDQIVNRNEFAEQSLCDVYHDKSLISVTSTGTLTIKNSEFLSFRQQLNAIVSNSCGNVTLIDVNFDECIPRFDGLNGGLIQQQCPDEFAPYYCGTLTYIGGIVSRMNNGYEYRNDIVLSGFMNMDGLNFLTIQGVLFEFNFVPIGETVTTYSSTLLMLRRFRQAHITNCTFQYNIASLSVGLTVIHSLKLPVVLDANNVGVDHLLHHLILTDLLFRNNTSQQGTGLYIQFQTNHQNVIMSNCTFINNFSTKGELIIIHNNQLLSRYLDGEFVPTWVAGSIIDIWIPPRYVNMSGIVFRDNYAFGLASLTEIGNLVLTDINATGNGDSLSDIFAFDYIIREYADDPALYLSAYSSSFPSVFQCTSGIIAQTVLKLNVSHLLFADNYCPQGSPGIAIHTNPAIVSLDQFTFRSNVGAELVHSQTTTAVPITNLTCHNNTNHNSSKPVCISIDLVAPAAVLVLSSTFTDNAGDSTAVAAFFNTKSVLIKDVRVEGNVVRFSSAGVMFSPYPYAESSLFVVDSVFRWNEADSEGIITVSDFYGVLSDNFAAVVTLYVENCDFEDNSSKYDGSAITLNIFIQFTANSLITNCRFLRNFSETGASLNFAYQTGQITVSFCSFQYNSSPEGGSGLYSHQYENSPDHPTFVFITKCTFQHNSGSAVTVVGYFHLTELYSTSNVFDSNSESPVLLKAGYYSDLDSEYVDNAADYGGAIKMTQNSVVEIQRSRFSGNTANIDGGAVHASAASFGTFAKCVFENNTSEADGGVVYADSSLNLALIECVVQGNRAVSSGSIAFLFSSLLHVVRSVVRNNSAGEYAGMVLIRAFTEIINSTIAGNSAPMRTSGLILVASTLNVSHSFFANQTSTNGGFILSVNNNDIHIDNSTFYGGAAVQEGGAIYIALETNLYIVDSAFEKCNAALQGGALFVGKSSLTGVNTTFVDTSAVTGGVLQTIDAKVVLVGCTLERYAGGAVKADSCDFLIVAKSKFVNEAGTTFRGGAIYSTDCVVVNISESIFKLNKADSGGALYFFSTIRKATNDVYQVTNSTFDSNLALSGGAIESDGVDFLLINCSFVNNSAIFSDGSLSVTNGEGGGVVARCENSKACKVAIVGNRFVNNSATLEGGAVHWRETVPTFTDNEFVGNSAAYGRDTGSFAIALAPVSDTFKRLPYEGVTNGSIPLAFTVKNVVSGQPYLGTLRFALFDHLSERIITDNSSSIELQSTDEAVISGKSKETSSFGVFQLSDFAITAEPGTTHIMRLYTNGVDLKKKTVCNDSATYVAEVDIKVEFRQCVMGEALTDGACVVCQAETYSLNPTIPCKTCLSSAVCYGGYLMVPKKGYWRAANDTDTFFECINADACIGSPEPPNVSLTGLCAEGYTGNLCQVCLADYSRTGRSNCARCPGKTANISISTLIVLVALIGIGLVVAVAIRGAMRPRSLVAIYFKIFLNYLQMVVVAASLNLNWPNFVKAFLSSQEQAGGMADQLFSFECLMKDFGPANDAGMFTSKLVVAGLLPLALIIVSVASWGTLLLVKTVDKLIHKVIASFVVILFIVHPSITKMMFSVYSCMEILPGEPWLIADLSEKCWTNKHIKTILLISVPSLVVWVLGLPTLVLGLLIRSRQRLNDMEHRLMYSFLYKGYEQKWFYWEFVILYRKIAIVSSSVFLSPVSIKVESLTILAILLLAIFAQLRYQPFNDPTLNKLEVKSILVSAITIYSGLYYSTQSIGQIINILIFVIIIISNAYFLITWLVYISPVILTTIREKWRQLTKMRKPYRVQHANSSTSGLKDFDKSEISSSSLHQASSSPFEPTLNQPEPTESMVPPCNTPDRMGRELTDPSDPAYGRQFSLR